MIKLQIIEEYSYDDVLNLCSQGITGNDVLKNHFLDERESLLLFKDQYQTSATTSQLFSISPIDVTLTPDPNVIGSLKKTDLEKIYTQYFAAESKPARAVYDAMLNCTQK